jgi:transcriptional regulator with XRE-family HTH domain
MIDTIIKVLAERLRTERGLRGWSLADLASRSGVSKATLSKIEREDVSPTAVVLSRVATAFGITLAELLTEKTTSVQRLLRREEQPTWRDPDTSYIRRQVFMSARSPLELVHITLPPGKSLSFPSSAYERAKHVVWVLAGKLTILEGAEENRLSEGDRLEFGLPGNLTYRNAGRVSCQYLVALLRI